MRPYNPGMLTERKPLSSATSVGNSIPTPRSQNNKRQCICSSDRLSLNCSGLGIYVGTNGRISVPGSHIYVGHGPQDGVGWLTAIRSPIGRYKFCVTGELSEHGQSHDMEIGIVYYEIRNASVVLFLCS